MPGEEMGTSPIAGISSESYQQAPPTTPYGPPVAGQPGAPGMPGAPLPSGQPSPYAGLPPHAPPGAGQNRTPLFVALGVLAAVVFVGIIIIATNDGGGGGGGATTTTSDSVPVDDTTVSTPVDPPDDPDDTSAPPADGDIALTEQNFTVSMDELTETDTLAYGFVVENTTDQAATNVSMQIGFLDESGTVVADDTQLLNVLMPGQTFGLGNSGVEVRGDPVEMQVTLSDPTWASPDAYGEITTSGISTSIDDTYGAPSTSFTAESTYDEQLDGPYAYVIYRNSDGEIVGGAWSTMTFLQADGSSTGEVNTYYTIDGVDESQTEVYIDPGFL
jgi:hypothetical protein